MKSSNLKFRRLEKKLRNIDMNMQITVIASQFSVHFVPKYWQKSHFLPLRM